MTLALVRSPVGRPRQRLCYRTADGEYVPCERQQVCERWICTQPVNFYDHTGLRMTNTTKSISRLRTAIMIQLIFWRQPSICLLRKWPSPAVWRILHPAVYGHTMAWEATMSTSPVCGLQLYPTSAADDDYEYIILGIAIMSTQPECGWQSCPPPTPAANDDYDYTILGIATMVTPTGCGWQPCSPPSHRLRTTTMTLPYYGDTTEVQMAVNHHRLRTMPMTLPFWGRRLWRHHPAANCNYNHTIGLRIVATTSPAGMWMLRMSPTGL